MQLELGEPEDAAQVAILTSLRISTDHAIGWVEVEKMVEFPLSSKLLHCLRVMHGEVDCVESVAPVSCDIDICDCLLLDGSSSKDRLSGFSPTFSPMNTGSKWDSIISGDSRVKTAKNEVPKMGKLWALNVVKNPAKLGV